MLRHIAAIGFCLASVTSRAAASEQVVVVELFTSQGCSSCPQADAFLTELAKNPELLALSEHVDYWDYLGWKDPFASPDNTRRQRDYARRLGLGYVYTPQIVVHGIHEAAGTDRSGVLHQIVEAQSAQSVVLDLGRTEDGTWVAHLGKTAPAEVADIWFVRFEPVQLTRVVRGENGGRRIENTNVVREFRRLGTWKGEAASLPLPSVVSASGEGHAILVQQTNNGRILAAARLPADAH